MRYDGDEGIHTPDNSDDYLQEYEDDLHGHEGDDGEDGDGSGQNAHLRWSTYIGTSHPPQTTTMMKILMEMMLLVIEMVIVMVVVMTPSSYNYNEKGKPQNTKSSHINTLQTEKLHFLFGQI